MNALMVCVAVALAAPKQPAVSRAVDDAEAQPVRVRLEVGGHVGFPHWLGVVARTTWHFAEKPRFDLDLQWEPSNYLQSYSVGGAWRPLDSIVYVGPRLRWLQFVPPWSRAYDGAGSNKLGLSAEAGVRVPLGQEKRAVLGAGLFATWVPAQPGNLSFLFGLTVGLTYGLADFAVDLGER